MAVAWKSVGHRKRRLPQSEWESVEARLIVTAEITAIASEKLIPAYAGKDDGHFPARELRNQICRYECRVGDGLVHMPEQARKERHDIRTDKDLVMVRLKTLRNPARGRKLVVIGLGLASLESNGVSLDGTVAVRGHERDDGARVDPSRKKRTDGYVADHLESHRFFEARARSGHPVRCRARSIDIVRRPPVTPLLNASTRGDQQCRCRKLAHASKHRLRRGHVAKRQIGAQCRRIELGTYSRQCEERLGLTCERETPRVAPHIKRLDPQSITRDEQALPWHVPQRKCEHAIDPLDAGIAVALIEMKQRLAVGFGLEAMALRSQLTPQFAVVVNLTVGNQPKRAVFV